MAEAYSARTLVQSHANSSATIIGSDVKMPSPISDWATRITTLSSGSMRIQAFTSLASAGAALSHGSGAIDSALATPGSMTPMARPPAADEVAIRKRRRLSSRGALRRFWILPLCSMARILPQAFIKVAAR